MSTQNSSPPTEDIPDDTAQIGEEFAVVNDDVTRLFSRSYRLKIPIGNQGGINYYSLVIYPGRPTCY